MTRFTSVMVAVSIAFASESLAAEAQTQCSNIPPHRYAAGADFDRAWSAKRAALIDGINTLKKLRADLSGDYKWKVGDAGSAREFITLVAAVTKTTTDLIQDLVPLGGEMKTLATLPEKMRDIAEIVSEVEERKAFWWVTGDIIVTLGAELSPIMRGLNTTKDLGKNIRELGEIPSNLDESRRVYLEQIDVLGTQLDQLRQKLDRLERANREDAVDRLFAHYNVVRQMCASETARERREENRISCERSCDNWFGGPHAKLNAECKADCTK